MPDELGQPIHNGWSLSQSAETERLNLGGTACCRPKLELGTPTRASPKATPRRARHLSPLPTGNNFYDFQFIVRVQLPPGKFRRCDCFAVVFHHHAARRKLLRDQKLLNRARQLRLDLLSVGDNRICVHENRLSNSLCVPIQIHSIVSPLRTPTARYCSLMRTDQRSFRA